VTVYPYVPEGREAVYLTGDALAAFIKELTETPPLRSVRVSGEDGVVRWKIDSGVWSPPYPQEPDPQRTH
jgi:hypothetical protein